jgi:hypothetical protein
MGTYYSENWGGYIYCPSNCLAAPPSGEQVTYVIANWTVPWVASTSSSTEFSATWVGIGGFGTDDLFQAGTWESIASGGTEIVSAWWEMLPGYAQFVSLSPDSTISPGNMIWTAVGLDTTSGGHQYWYFQVYDVTTDSYWDGVEECASGCNPSSFETADFIQESPAENNVIVQIPAFTSFRFFNDLVMVGSDFYSLDSLPASGVHAVYQENPTYLEPDGIVPSNVSEVDSNSYFYAQYLVDTVDYNGPSYSVSPPTAAVGETVHGFEEISSPDSFGPSRATNLALWLELFNSSSLQYCFVPADSTVLTITSGYASYETSLTICSGLATGAYSFLFYLWYTPPSVEAGNTGSLILATSGWQTGFSVTPYPEVPTPTGSPGSADVGQTITFSASASGGSGGFSYVWSGLPAGCVSANTASLSCTPTAAGTTSVTVRATDSEGDSIASGALAYTVYNDPTVGSISAAPASVDVGQSVTISVQASSGSGGYSYVWSGLPTGCSGSGASIVCAPSGSGTFSISVAVTDSNGWTVTSAAFPYAVDNDTTVSSISASPASVDVGYTVTFSVQASNGSGGYSYVWSGLPTGCSGSNASIVCAPNGTGAFSITVAVTDSNGWTATSSAYPFTVLGDPTVGSISASPASVDAGQVVTISVHAFNGSGNYSYLWSGLPTGCFGSTASIACTPRGAGTFSISVRVTDSNGGHATSPTISYTVYSALAGTLTSSPSSMDIGQGGTTFDASVTGGYGTYVYSWTGLPTGCSPENTAELACDPSLAGVSTVMVSVTDLNGGTWSARDTFTVYTDPIIFGFGASPNSILENTATQITTDVTGGMAPISYDYLDLPSGCTSANVSVLSCTPSSTGTFTVKVIIHDANGFTTSQSTTLTVNAELFGLPAVDAYALIGGGAAAVAVAAAAAVLLVSRRRKRRGRQAMVPPPPPNPPPGAS